MMLHTLYLMNYYGFYDTKQQENFLGKFYDGKRQGRFLYISISILFVFLSYRSDTS